MDPLSGKFQNQTVLVVGGAGFVGSNLVRRLAAMGAARVVVVDNFLSAEKENLPSAPNVELRVGSIADDAVLKTVGDDFDYVFHLATYHGNQSSIANPIEDHANNLITTLKLFDKLKGAKKLKKLVYAASGCVLAPHTMENPEPVKEEGLVPFDLDSPYQISKVVGEFYAVYYFRQHKLPTVRARFQNVYGPGEVLGAGQWRGTPATVWRNVTPTFIYKSIKGESLPLQAEGASSRDFIFVDDIVEGLLRCAAQGKSGEVYNLSTATETTIAELAKLINELTGNKAPVKLLPRRPWDFAGRRVGSAEMAEREIGFKAKVPVREGLERTVRWTKENLPFIEKCISKHKAQLGTAGEPA